jgi:ubiquinone/menaquinone biosynthesis C-methylase UbiE
MVYEVMDVTCMTYPDRMFDLVLDKSTIDALICSENPYINSAKMVEQVERVLKDDGLYLVVSYSDSRKQHLCREHVTFDSTMEKMTKLN